ncbi:MAG: cytochrome c [Betaproteobacteria bacterium]
MLRIVAIVVVAVVLVGCSKPRSAGTSFPQPADQTREEQAETKTTETGTHEGHGDKLLLDKPAAEEFPHLHNLLQLTERIYSGGEPEDDQAFHELAKLGVRTIVSVDGARPDIALAEKYGFRYVHIPIGYDGVPAEAGLQFASLLKNADGPFYIHCHHGKHRGPAGAAVACIADGAADGKSALAILEQAGTSKDYAGLWRDVQAYTPPAEGADLPELVSVAEVGSLVAAMANIDRASDNLKLCAAAAAWKAPAEHPDVAPAQQALLLKEGFRETVRQLVESNDYDEQFLTWMKEAEELATTLESALQANDDETAAATFSKIQDQCKQCHGKYRN